MAKVPTVEMIATDCLASGTQYARVGITHATVQQTIVRGFVERDRPRG
jgi:hypothetical protein